MKIEACWVLLNATSCGSDQQIEFLVEHGCVGVLCDLLSHPNMLIMAVEGLEKLLQVGNETACRLSNCKQITDANCGPNLHASKSKSTVVSHCCHVFGWFLMIVSSYRRIVVSLYRCIVCTFSLVRWLSCVCLVGF